MNLIREADIHHWKNDIANQTYGTRVQETAVRMVLVLGAVISEPRGKTGLPQAK